MSRTRWPVRPWCDGRCGEISCADGQWPKRKRLTTAKGCGSTIVQRDGHATSQDDNPAVDSRGSAPGACVWGVPYAVELKQRRDRYVALAMLHSSLEAKALQWLASGPAHFAYLEPRPAPMLREDVTRA